MKITITGSTGFVGSNVVEALLNNFPPSNLALLIRNRTKLGQLAIPRLNQTKIILGDLTSQNDCDELLEFQPDVVFHSAALVDDTAPRNKLLKVNVQGTKNLVEAILNVSPASHLIHISSSGVYPRITNLITEDTPVNPLTNYGRSKAQSEEVVLDAIREKKLFATILRPPNVMGIRDTTQMAKICLAIQQGKFPLINQGKTILTWLGGEDMAQAAILCVKNRDISQGQIYNLKSFEITVRELYTIIAEKLNVETPPKSYNYYLAYTFGILGEINGKIRGKSSTLNRYRVLKFARDRRFDDTKIREQLGYFPKCSALETITKTLDWLIETGRIQIL